MNLKKIDMLLYLHEIQHPTAVSTIHQNSGLCLQKREVFAVTILVFHNSRCWGMHVRKSRHSRDLFWMPRGAKNGRRVCQTQCWGHLISKRVGETWTGLQRFMILGSQAHSWDYAVDIEDVHIHLSVIILNWDWLILGEGWWWDGKENNYFLARFI